MSNRDDTASTDRDVPQIIVEYLGSEIPLLEYLEHGIEEEGVPWIVRQTRTAESDPNHQRNGPTSVAHQAASDSGLNIGIGISEEGDLVLHHARLADDKPLFSLTNPTASQARTIGTNAARLAKRMPLIPLD